MKKIFHALPLLFTALSMMSCSFKSSTLATYQTALKTSPSSFGGPPTPTEFRIVMGTRWMVSSTLEDIFGKTTPATGGVTVQDVTSHFVLDQPSSWGGPCDPYANSHPVPHARPNGGIEMVVETPSVRGCSASVYSQSAMLPNGSTSRLAWTIRACDRIVSSDAAVLTAATQAGYLSTAAISTPPSEQNIRNAFDVFHPGVPLSSAGYTGLKEVVDEANRQFPNSPEAWRFLLLTLCSSPGWQML